MTIKVQIKISNSHLSPRVSRSSREKVVVVVVVVVVVIVVVVLVLVFVVAVAFPASKTAWGAQTEGQTRL